MRGFEREFEENAIEEEEKSKVNSESEGNSLYSGHVASRYGFSLVLLSTEVFRALHCSAAVSCCPGTKKTFIFTCSSSTLRISSHFSKAISILLVATNGLPRMIGACSSASQSRIKKSAGNINLSTHTRMSSIFPSGVSARAWLSVSLAALELAAVASPSPLATSVSLENPPTGLDFSTWDICPTWFSRDLRAASWFCIRISVLSMKASVFWMNCPALAGSAADFASADFGIPADLKCRDPGCCSGFVTRSLDASSYYSMPKDQS
ncbi:hypothetical protein V6N13_108437 [Hibiscus sabdariffa]